MTFLPAGGSVTEPLGLAVPSDLQRGADVLDLEVPAAFGSSTHPNVSEPAIENHAPPSSDGPAVRGRIAVGPRPVPSSEVYVSGATPKTTSIFLPLRAVGGLLQSNLSRASAP